MSAGENMIFGLLLIVSSDISGTGSFPDKLSRLCGIIMMACGAFQLAVDTAERIIGLSS